METTQPPKKSTLNSPGEMAAGGALIGVTLGNVFISEALGGGWTGAAIGCIACYLIGKAEQKKEQNKHD